MPAPISIVIPTLDAADRIGPLLARLTEGLTEGLIRDLVLTDGGSADDIIAVAEAAGATLVTGPAGRGGQLARGAAAAAGDWLLFLHADSLPDPGWTKALRRHMQVHPDMAGHFDLRFDSAGAAARAVAGWANLRSRAFALPYGDQGLFIPAALYRRVGGYPELPLMEDVAIARRLGRAGLISMGHGIETSAERYRREGWLRRGALNLSTLALYLAGRDPARLAQRYRGRTAAKGKP